MDVAYFNSLLEFLDSLVSNWFIASQLTSYNIDNIFSNIISDEVISGNIAATISRVFQKVLRGGEFFIGWWKPAEEWFLLFRPFSKLVVKFCKCWKLIQIKINMTFVYKGHANWAMAEWWRRWIPNPGVLCLKPLGASKVDSAFHPFKVDKMSTRNFWEPSIRK